VALAVVLIDAFVIAMGWRSLCADRKVEYDKAARDAANLAGVLAENLEGTIAQIDLALLGCADALETINTSGGSDRRRTEELVVRTAARIPFVDAIRATDAAGRVVLGSGVDPFARVHVGDRDYFLEARADRTGRMAISKPLVSRISGKKTIGFARPYHRPDGAFGGVVYAAVPFDSFTRTLSRVKLERGGVVVLRSSDNAIVARFPEREGMERILGLKRITPELEAILASEAREATFVAASPVDRQEKVNAFRRVSNGPFYLLVAQESRGVLERWRTQVLRTATALGLFVLLTALAGWRLQASLRKESETRFRALVEEAPIAVALVRGGKVLYANRAFAPAFGLASPAAAVGHLIDEGMAPEDAARARDRFDRLQRGLEVDPTAEFTITRPDGATFRALVTDATTALGDGPAVVGFIQDVTEQRRSAEERERLIGELRGALAEVKTLSGLLPICAHCKKIRDDRGYWSRIETYIRERSNAEFTHGICPDCAQRYFDEDADPSVSSDPKG
jgi:PAS domain S-box-containing protein